MSAAVTPYALALVADSLGQLSGAQGAPILKPTFAAAVAIDAGPNGGSVQEIDGVNGTSATCAVTTVVNPGVNKILILICKAAGGTVTYTFGTGFKPTGTAAPTTGTTIVVAFISDGSNFFEFARSASAITG